MNISLDYVEESDSSDKSQSKQYVKVSFKDIGGSSSGALNKMNSIVSSIKIEDSENISQSMLTNETIKIVSD